MQEKIIDVGKAVFIDWDTLDALAMKWAKEYFAKDTFNFAKAKTEREEYTSCIVRVYDLGDTDEEKFRALYARYDADGDYCVDEDFAETAGGRYCSLPECISRGILSEMLPGVRVGTVIACYGGVLITSKHVNVDNPWAES